MVSSAETNTGFVYTDHFNFIEAAFENSPDGFLDGPYSWAGRLEEKRLVFQNTKGGWGETHVRYLDKLHQQGLRPDHIATIGVGPDATTLSNLMDIFPQAQRYTAIELDAAKIQAARETLANQGYDINKVTFIQANAVDYLAQHPEAFDLVDTHLLLQHLNRKQHQQMITAITSSLKPSGHLVVGDLELQAWDAHVHPDFATNPEAIELANQAHTYIHGDDRRPGALTLGWRGRGAHAWSSPEEIATTITTDSKHTLVLQPDSVVSHEVKGFGPDTPESVVTAYITITLFNALAKAHQGISQALNQAAEIDQPQLQARQTQIAMGKEILKTQGPVMLQALRDPRVIHDYPTIHYMTLTKQG